MSREVEEWRGKTDDSAIPPRVKLRVWTRCEGKCALTGRKLRPGDLHDIDHILALANGGEHRETNLQLVSREAHKVKTAADVATRAKTDRTRAKHLGIKTPSKRGLSKPPGMKFDWSLGRYVRADAQ